MSRFIRNESHPYSIITPDTPLAELAEFLHNNIFALGVPFLIFLTARSTYGNLVTDSNRKFVLAVATSQDLEVGLDSTAQPLWERRLTFFSQNFVSRRGI